MNRLTAAKRLVVKIGSAMLVDAEEGLREDWLAGLADDVAACRARGQDVVLVSSGTVALGRRILGLKAGATQLEDNQAAAATGQIQLAHAYQEALARHGIVVAQILLTATDTEMRRRYINARNTLSALLKRGVVPVVNENDTVATEEIRVGDNDRLAARVAAMLGADALVLLSDIDGLYSADPRKTPDAEFLPLVPQITPAIEAMAGKAPLGYSSGGMVTKLAAGKIATSAGCRMVIADGRSMNPLKAIEAGARCSWFLADAEPRTARKRWIAGALSPAGRLCLDAGALAALNNGKSLLPAGVTAVQGNFERGDAVVLTDAEGREIARGLTAYSAADARIIIGHKSRDIEALLGYRGREELVHRDDLVLTV